MVAPVTAESSGSLEGILEESSIRGAVVARFQGGATEVSGLGEAQADSRLRAGSVSKLMTALLVLRAEQAGVLSLDDTVESLWSGLIEGGEAVTLAMLLEHTSGLSGSTYAEYAAEADGMPPSEFARQGMPFKLRWQPGNHYSYSNSGITLEAALVEKAWGADFDELMQREVFDPLGMKDTDFSTGDGSDVLPSWSADGTSPMPRWEMTVRPAGSLVTTAGDLGKVLEMLIRRGKMFDGRVFLSEDRVVRMERGETSVAGRAGVAAYGLGNFGFVEADRIWRGHWGRTEGYQTAFGYLPEAGRGFVVMVDTADRRGMGAIRSQLAQKLSADLDPPSLESASGSNAKALPGWYANASHDMPMRGWLFALLEARRIELEPSGLRVSPLIPATGAQRWTEVGENRYRVDGVPVASGTFSEVDGRDYWIDGESFVRRSAFSLWFELGVMLVGLLVAMLLIPVLLFQNLRAAMKKTERPGVELWMVTGGGLCLFALMAGFMRWGLFGSGGELGVISVKSVLLVIFSILGPGLAVIGTLMAFRNKRWVPAVMGCLLLAWSLQLMIRGWIPLVTWSA